MNPLSEFLNRLPEIQGLHAEASDPDLSPVAAAASLSGDEGTVLLMSGGDLDCARFDLLGARPWLTLKGWGRRLRLEAAGDVLETEGDPFEALRAVLDRFPVAGPDPDLPMAAGLLGYLAYDLKDRIEALPRTSVDRWRLPHICLYAPSVLLVRDRRTGQSRLFLPIGSGMPDPETRIRWLEGRRAAGRPAPERPTVGGEWRSNFTRSDYLEALERIRDYIAAGHVYQVNMSQRFEAAFQGDPYDLFTSLFRKNPAPFFAFIQAGDHQVVSTSPERFLLRRGPRVETRPIKGTRPRGSTPEADAAFREDLLSSRKDDAELSMIVDLLRNDIGKVCEAGSVRVTQHKRVEAYQNVYHLVSIVEGRLAATCDSVDLLRATFPGGSITGCPKIRSMEIIDELEPERRHVYTGAIGYLSFHDTMDLSVAIRTATVCRERIAFSVGGGIVFDSEPATEYDETLHKGRTLLSALESCEAGRHSAPTAWIDGHLKPADRAAVGIADQGVLYGNGCFETLRVEKGVPRRLDAHLERFRGTWAVLFGPEPFPDLTWEEVIRQVVERNGLAEGVAAVRITATRGNPEAADPSPTLFVTAKAYRARLSDPDGPGLRLLTYPHPRLSPLSDHKTLNYLYYLQAGQWARARGADEALVLNPDGTVSETHTANLLVISGGTVVRPASPHVLPGVMERAVLSLLEGEGYAVVTRPLTPEDLLGKGQVVATNALMGAVPVAAVDGRPLAGPSPLVKRVRRRLIAGDGA